jgi:hypothetical protein
MTDPAGAEVLGPSTGLGWEPTAVGSMQKGTYRRCIQKKKELGIGEFTEFTYIILHNPTYIYYTGTVHHMMCCVG